MTAPPPLAPFWFGQRQCKLEPQENGMYRASGPNLAEAFLGIRSTAHGRWAPVFRLAADGPDLAEAHGDFARPQEAWEAAFELYRIQVVV
jgi:hypothetical protein